MSDNKPKKRSLGSILWGVFILLLVGGVYGLLKPYPKPYKPLYEQINEEPRRIHRYDITKPSSINDSGKCSIHTNGLDRSNGVNMNVFYPCQWQEYSENYSKIPTMIKQFVYTIDDSCTLLLSFDISHLKIDLTPAVIDDIRKPEKLKKLTMNGDVFISSTILNIDGIKADEVISKKIRETGDVMYSYTFHFYYMNNMITLVYGVWGMTDKKANDEFIRRGSIFKYMGEKTKFYK